MGRKALALLLATAWPLCGKWVLAESAPFLIYTDAGERTARETLERLRLAHHAFALPGGPPLPFPVTVFVLASGERFRKIRPGETTRGFYQSAAGRDYIAADAGATELGRVVSHEFAHLVLHHSVGPLPQWLEEGLAEFYSTLQARNERVMLGAPVPEHLRLLAVSAWLSAQELAAVTQQSDLYHEAGRVGLFYAQSWALTHMLRLGEGYRDGFASFIAALAAGQKQAAAFQQAFGCSLSEAVTKLKGYLAQGALPLAELRINRAALDAPVRLTPLDDAQADLAYAELALAAGKAELAGALYEKLARRNAADTRSVAALGLLALACKRTEQATRHLRDAVARPDAPAEAFFEYAMLLRDGGADKDQVRKLLEQTIARNPNFAEAHFLLGLGDANEGRHQEALPHFERAVAVFPRQSDFWHALAMSRHALGRREDARRAAQRALDAAANVRQAEMARAALRLVEAAAQTAPPRRPPVTTPSAWSNPEGDRKVEGILEQIDCLGDSARLLVRVGSLRLPLLVDKPGEVLLKNFSSATFEFRCGAQKPTPVVIEYLGRPEPRFGAAGRVTAIEFR